METTTKTTIKMTSAQRACRYCGTLPHIPQGFGDNVAGPDETAEHFHGSAACVDVQEPLR